MMIKEKFKLFQDTDTHKIPLKQILFSPWGLVLDNLKRFFMLGLSGAVILSAFNFLSGNSLACMYQSFLDNAVYCEESPYLQLIYFFIKLFLLAAYAYVWVNYSKEIFTQKTFIKNVLKMGSFQLLAIILFLGLPVLSFFLLQARVPTPDWRLEAIYFIIVSLGFFGPFLFARLAPIWAIWAENKQIQSLKSVWAMGQGNTLRMTLGYFVILFIGLYLFIKFYAAAAYTIEGDSIVSQILAEITYNFLFLFIFTLTINSALIDSHTLSQQAKNKAA